MTEQISQDNQPVASSAPARLTAWQLVSYGLLTMPIAMAGLALLTYLPTFYAVDMGLGLGLVGAIFVAGRLFDIFTDPLIGHLSDSTRSRFGPRKPWMLAGLTGFLVTTWFLLVPPQGAGAAYLVLAGSAFFLFFTMLDIPYSSSGLEISPYVDERSRLAGSKAGFQVAGAILAGTMPLLLATTASGSLPSIAWIVVGLAVVGFVLFVVFVPGRHAHAEIQPRVGFFAALQTVLHDRRYACLIGTFFIIQLGNAFFTALGLLFITYIIKAPGLAGLFFGLMFLSTALALPLWLAVARRIGKARCWQAGIIVSIAAFACAPLIGEGDVVMTCILFAVVGSTFGCDAVMPTSLLADISSDQTGRSGKRLSGVYLSVKNATSKMSFVAPMGLAFPTLGYLNFETSETHSVAVTMAFMGFFALAPILLKLLGIYVLRRSPDFQAELQS